MTRGPLVHPWKVIKCPLDFCANSVHRQETKQRKKSEKKIQLQYPNESLFTQCNTLSIKIFFKFLTALLQEILFWEYQGRTSCGRHPLENLKEYGLLRETYSFKLLKTLLQILLCSFLNTLAHILSNFRTVGDLIFYFSFQ